jgi:hypothetical protein
MLADINGVGQLVQYANLTETVYGSMCLQVVRCHAREAVFQRHQGTVGWPESTKSPTYV